MGHSRGNLTRNLPRPLKHARHKEPNFEIAELGNASVAT